MNEKTLRALVDAGAVKRLRLVANGARFHAEADTATSTHVAMTLKGTPKNWGSLDVAAKWVHSLGIGSATLDLSKWQPNQRALRL